MKFSKYITINQQFQRSVEITKDISDVDSLKGFICPESSKNLLENMVKNIEAGQCSFTWTGTYGSGKSSLVLLLSALISSDKKLNNVANDKVGKDLGKSISKTISPKASRLIIPIIGRPECIIETFKTSLKGIYKNTEKIKNSDDIIQLLEKESKKGDGIIIFVDEMGKFLDGAVAGKTDVYIFQQLAELANRSNGKIILVGILHQSFTEYSRSLSVSLRDEWQKIQGRFVDLAVNVAGEEQLALIGSAITYSKPYHKIEVIKTIADNISNNKNIDIKNMQKSLEQTFPLHPIVSCLLGPISKRKFGQNQRSIFAFLVSSEAGGFKDFINNTDFNKNTLFKPSALYDYLRFNLETSIIGSSDASKWIAGVEAIKRCEEKGGDLHHVDLLKTIVLIDMFSKQAGISANKEVLLTITKDKKTLDKLLGDLKKWSIIIYKKYQDTFSIYGGSDFNIDEALQEASSRITSVNLSLISEIAHLRPILAKKHYHITGAMRWFDIKLQFSDEFEKIESGNNKSCGSLVIFLNKKSDLSAIRKKINYDEYPALFSFASNYDEIIEYGKDLEAYKWILENKSELTGDLVARQEIIERITSLQTIIESKVQSNIFKSTWYGKSTEYKNAKQGELSSIISKICDEELYPNAINIKSELVNRDKPSGSANTAVNNLVKAMVAEEGEPDLGFEGFPAEKGLYKIFLEKTGMYKDTGDDFWEYCEPDDSSSLKILWTETDAYLKKNDIVELEKIIEYWSKKPFGIKKGMSTILLMAYLKTREDKVAVYLDTVYSPIVDDLFVDYMLKNLKKTSIKWVALSKAKIDFLQKIKYELGDILKDVDDNPLHIAREIIFVFDSLSKWTIRTRTFDKKTIELRNALGKANDPYKLLFTDLKKIFDKEKDMIKDFGKSFRQIIEFYPSKMEEVGRLLSDELQVMITPGNIGDLHERARKVFEQKSDLRVGAFAGRLKELRVNEDGTMFVNDLSGIAGFASNVATDEWIDLDFERSKQEIAILCTEFKKVELYTYVNNNDPERTAFACMIGSGRNVETFTTDFTVLKGKSKEIAKTKKELEKILDNSNNKDINRAAIIELAKDYLGKEN